MNQIIFDLIEKEKNRQINSAELIASENFVSNDVMKAVGSVLTNKYAEGYPGKRYYGGCEVVDEIETLAIERAKQIFGAEYANVQPHSGSQANAAVFLACLKPGDSILGFDLSNGGHLTHGSPVNFSGIIYDAHFYGVEKETGRIDYPAMQQKAHEVKPKIIICGASAYSRDIDYAFFRKVADEVGAILLADISHPAGLIAKGLLNNPFEHCHIVTTTTHKTLRGPRGGMILIGKDFENPFGKKFKNGKLKMMSSLLDSAVFPGYQGGPLEHVIAGKAVAFGEILDESFTYYAKQIQLNAKAMAEELVSNDFNIISGGTDNHCLLLDLRNKGITGKDAERKLEDAGITCNKNMVPFDTASPFVTSGVRIGTAAITTRGLKESEAKQIATFINEVISGKNEVQTIKKEVEGLMSKYPLWKA